MSTTLIPGRVANFLDTPVVNKDGQFTDEWRNIMQQVFQSLQLNFGNEGLVMPTQTDANITTIQNNVDNNGNPTAQYGTILYDSTNNSIRISINNGLNAPIFKTVTLT